MHGSTRDRFAALARAPSEAIRLDEAALLIAAEQYPDLDLAETRHRLDALAHRVRERCPSGSERARVTALAQVLSQEAGFRGNTEDYYDPRNSFLNDVVQRRLGIPITLGIVYMEVARRVDLPLVGVSFPAHFLVRYPGPEEPVILDAFNGGAEIEPSILLAKLGGAERAGAARLLSRLLAGATSKEILVRLLGNLKAIFVGRREYHGALAAVGRMLLLAPDAARELRDRAWLHAQLECHRAALDDYARYLTLVPDDPDATAIRAAMIELRRQVDRLN